MKLNHNTFSQFLTLTMGLMLAVGSLIWVQGAASPAAAQEPVDLPTISLRLVMSENGLDTFEVEPPPVFNVGDRFRISIVAEGVPEPGIFGSQFKVVYDPEKLLAIEGSLASGDAMEPVVVAVADFDVGVVSWAASRKGALADIPGNVVLANLTMEAIGATEPPEGQTTRIDLQDVKLGRKGGIEVDVAGLVPLDVIIRDDGTIPGDGDMIGNVTVESRAADNQAGHSVQAIGDLGGVFDVFTEANGDFFFNNIPADTYDVTADRAGFLAATCEDVAHSDAALTVLANVTLLAGDIDGDGIIDITDSSAIGLAFGSTAPDEVADLNDDGVVDVLDLISHSVNFGQTSEANPWIC